MNLEHPKWLTADFKEKLYAFFDESFHFLSRSTEMIRLLSGSNPFSVFTLPPSSF